MAVSMLLWSAVLMISFELARRARAYDYRSFFKLLLGPGWFLFEIAYFLLMIIVMAVMGAAAGEITNGLFGPPKLVGSLAMIAGTGLVLFYSNAIIEKFLALSVGYLYLVYLVFVVWSVVAFGDRIAANFASVPVGTSGSRPESPMPATTLPRFPRSCSAFAILRAAAKPWSLDCWPVRSACYPASLFYIAMMGYYHEIGAEPCPRRFCWTSCKRRGSRGLFRSLCCSPWWIPGWPCCTRSTNGWRRPTRSDSGRCRESCAPRSQSRSWSSQSMPLLRSAW